MARSLGIFLGEGGCDEGGDHAAALAPGMGQQVAHEMHAAALPGGMEDLCDRGLQPFMRVRDHQLDAAQAAASELAQELGPEGLGLRGADVQPEHLAAAITVDTDRDDGRDRDDAAVRP
jgi:hypothetical protein